MAGFIAGFAIIAYCPVLLPLLAWLLALWPVWWSIHYAPRFGRQLAGFLLASFIATWYGTVQLEHRLSADLATSTFNLTGRVEGLVLADGSYRRFDLAVSQLQSTEASMPLPTLRQVRLSWYNANLDLFPGDELVVEVRLKPPHSLWNPYGFDYERWALVNRIDAVGYVRAVTAYHPQPGQASLRSHLAGWISQRFQSQEVAASLRALWVGDKSALSDTQWQLLRETGTLHLMVVSGLHIGVIMALGWWFGRGINGLLYRGKESWHNPFLLPVLAALLLSAGYVLLAGFSVPTQRAWLMGLVILGAKLWGCYISVWQRWLWAMALVLVLQPLALLESGFWLSFGAVAVLLALLEIRDTRKGPGYWGLVMLKTQWWIFIFLAPLLAFSFGQIALAAPWVNLLAIPAISLLVVLSVPALLLEAAGFILPLNWLAEAVVLFWKGLAVTAEQSDVLVVSLPAQNLLGLLFALAGAVLVFQPLLPAARWLGALCWLPLLFMATPKIAPGEFAAQVFDVGQGTAIWIGTSEHQLLYDTGAGYASGATALQRSVLPFFQARGIDTLDKLIISHDDNDHAGGAVLAAESLHIGRIESGMPQALAALLHRPVTACGQGLSWQWSGVEFRYLNPDLPHASDNDRSCILEVTGAHCRLLLTGDATVGVEQQLLEAVTDVDWLLAGHHGSKSSTSADFLNQTRPESVIASAGFMNPYHHPHPQVQARVAAAGAKLYRTDRQGALSLGYSATEGCYTRTWRGDKKRYWSGS